MRRSSQEARHIRREIMRSRICGNAFPAAPADSPLFGVPMPEREKLRLKLEELYLKMLWDERERAYTLQIEDMIKRETSGFPLDPDQYRGIQLELFAPEINDECYAISQQRAADASYQSMLQTTEGINRTIEREKRAAIRSVGKAEIAQLEKEFDAAKIKAPPFTEWVNTDAYFRIVGGTANRDSDYYSKIADLTADPDLTMRIKEQIQAGEGIKTIVRKALRDTTNKEVVRHVENIVRTETTKAIEQARVETAKNSGYIKAYQFFAAHDYRTTIYCAERHLCLIDIDDQDMLEQCTPPLHYQCRSTLAELSRRQLERAGGYEQIEADRLKLENAPVFEW